jgi:hypothetical protein
MLRHGWGAPCRAEGEGEAAHAGVGGAERAGEAGPPAQDRPGPGAAGQDRAAPRGRRHPSRGGRRGRGPRARTVGKWRERSAGDRLEGLRDGPRGGAPRTVTGERVAAEPLARTLEARRAAGLARLRPQAAPDRGLRAPPPDPESVEKVGDIVGLCLSPPDRALVLLCADEETEMQAGPRARPAGAAAAPRPAGAARLGPRPPRRLVALRRAGRGRRRGDRPGCHRRHRAEESPATSWRRPTPPWPRRGPRSTWCSMTPRSTRRPRSGTGSRSGRATTGTSRRPRAPGSTGPSGSSPCPRRGGSSAGCAARSRSRRRRCWPTSSGPTPSPSRSAGPGRPTGSWAASRASARAPPRCAGPIRHKLRRRTAS